jgi:protein SCO1/2
MTSLWSSLPVWVRIAAVCVVMVGVRTWSQYSFNPSPPTLEATPSGRLANGTLPVLWNAPAFSAVDQKGQSVTDQDLRGHVWVADFIFTHCTSACPLMTAKMLLLQRAVQPSDIRFVSFSVDPEHDTPDVLKHYATLWNRDEARWLLLHTERETLSRTAAGMKVAIMPTDEQDVILHSSLFFLVDQQGRVRSVSDSNDDDAMKRLATDATTLARSTPQPSLAKGTVDTARAREGERLFAALGCAPCHTQAQVAPPIPGLFGRAVTLDDGHKIVADEAYVRESILDPTARLVTGYLPLMPSYRDHLNDEQVEQLVAYIRSLGESPPEGDAAGLAAAPRPASQSIAVDPVCQMRVVASATTPHADYQGKTYYFCSDHCQLLFARNPATYAQQ